MKNAGEMGRIVERLYRGDYRGAEDHALTLLRSQLNDPCLPSIFRATRLGCETEYHDAICKLDNDVAKQGDPLLSKFWRALTNGWSDSSDYNSSDYICMVDREECRAQTRLNNDVSEELLYITMILPIHVCNYRCSYCFLDHVNKTDMSKLALTPKIIEKFSLIPRRLFVELSPIGDIIAVPAMWSLYKELNDLPNLSTVELWSNLSRDLSGVLKYISPEKVVVVGTYHPTEFRNFERDKERFFDHVLYLRDHVADVTVNFVASSANMPYYDELRKRLEDMNVYLTVNALLGEHNGDGKIYPASYSEIEKKKISGWINNEFVSHFMLNEKRDNIRCLAGKDHIQVDYKGNVFRCEFVETHYGNMLDPEGPLIDINGRYCPKGGCSCKIYTGFIEPCNAEYRIAGTKHHYIKRAE